MVVEGGVNFLPLCVESCRMRADTAKAGRPPEVYAILQGSRDARAGAADECGRGIARGESGRGEG